MTLITEPHLAHPDDFYEALLDAHRGFTEEQSQLLNARLILLLANHVGDLDVLRQALAAARAGIVDQEGQPQSMESGAKEST